MRNWLVPAAIALTLTACAGKTEQAVQDGMIADGRAIAQTQCAGCHAVGTYGESPAAGAPPFRHVLSRYSGDALADDLIEGIRVAHAMPAFQFDPKGADALLAYLRSIQTSAPADAPERRKTP